MLLGNVTGNYSNPVIHNHFILECLIITQCNFMNGNNMKYKSLVLFSILLLLGQSARAGTTNCSVDTVFKMFGPDHKIVVWKLLTILMSKRDVLALAGRKTGGIKGDWAGGRYV